MRLWGVSAIVFLSLCMALSVAGAVTRSECTQVSSSRNVVAADTTKAKKERVRKETPTTAQLAKRPETQTVSSDENEDSSWSDCLGSFFGTFIGSICGSIFGGDDDDSEAAKGLTGENKVPMAADSQLPVGMPPSIEKFPYSGTIEPLGVGSKTVWLWDRPGAYLASGVTLEAIPQGTEVRVTNYELHAQTSWLQVSRLAPDAPRGWVRQEEVRELASMTTPEQMSLAEATGRRTESQISPEPGEERSAERPRWEFGAGVSMPVFSQKAVREEYNESAYRIGVEAGAFLPLSMKLGLRVDYLHANGTPLFEYVAGTITDSPQQSDLDIFSMGLSFGHSIPFAGRSGFFSYGLGPALFMVQESALIHVYEDDNLTSARTDELTKWKGGAEAQMTIGGLLGNRWPLSFQARFAFIPWKEEEEKSLTLDYLGTESIAFFSFGIGVGFYTF